MLPQSALREWWGTGAQQGQHSTAQHRAELRKRVRGSSAILQERPVPYSTGRRVTERAMLCNARAAASQLRPHALGPLHCAQCSSDTVTDLARLRGWSTLWPRSTVRW